MISKILSKIIATQSTSKAAYPRGLRILLISSGLTIITNIPALASKSKIQNIYFNTEHSLVIETKNPSTLNFSTTESKEDNLYSVTITNTKASHSISKKLSNKAFDVDIKKASKAVELAIKPKNPADYNIQTKTILKGLAYELELSPQEINNWQAINQTKPHTNNGDELDFKDSFTDDLAAKLSHTNQSQTDLHQLSAEASNHKLYTITQSKSEIDKFLEQLDPQLATTLEADKEFHDRTFRNIDSASLTELADTLAKQGHEDEASAAYRKAIELNASNINAKLGLAKSSKDENEKLANYLSSISDEALLEIGSRWFEEGYAQHDYKSIAKALVSFQLTILKNPQNPEYRLRYAQILERSGAEFYDQAAKRYLEAAALAKQDYLAGNTNTETILRNATESLIRILSFQGDFNGAAKYCATYINLGFKKFSNGQATLAVLKEVESNRNPFKESKQG